MSETARSNAANRGCIGLSHDLLVGASYPFRALVVLNQRPALWNYVLIPLLVNFVVGSVLYAGLLFAGLGAIDNWLAGLPAWAAFLEVLLQFLLVLILLIGIGFALLRFGVVLGAPWYSQLSEQLEQSLLGHQPIRGSMSLREIVRDLWLALVFEAQKLLLLLCIGLPMLLLNLIPALGTVLNAAANIALATVIVCLDFFDPALARRRLGLSTKLRMIRRTLPASASFGLVCLGLISIPFINLLAIPLCITAGTLFFCDHIWEELQREGPRATQAGKILPPRSG